MFRKFSVYYKTWGEEKKIPLTPKTAEEIGNEDWNNNKAKERTTKVNIIK